MSHSRTELKRYIKEATEPIAAAINCLLAKNKTIQPEVHQIDGVGSWTMPSNANNVKIEVVGEGAADTITVTTASGTQTLAPTEVLEFSTGVISNTLDGPLTVTTTNAGDEVIISYLLIS